MIIVSSHYFNQNHFTLFFSGYLIGSITEYLTSFLVELVLHTKWWDYSNNILNLNGRVCLLYSVFLGHFNDIFSEEIKSFFGQYLKQNKK